jgi:hypothetical protein
MTKDEFITERTRIISEMLDNPDKYGIYPTTKCFNALDELFDKINLSNKTKLDVPSEDEVVEESLNGHFSLFDRGWMSYFNDSERGIFIQGADWMKEEIIKRNK